MRDWLTWRRACPRDLAALLHTARRNNISARGGWPCAAREASGHAGGRGCREGVLHLEAGRQVEEARDLVDVVHLALDARVLDEPLESDCGAAHLEGSERGGARGAVCVSAACLAAGTLPRGRGSLAQGGDEPARGAPRASTPTTAAACKQHIEAHADIGARLLLACTRAPRRRLVAIFTFLHSDILQ